MLDHLLLEELVVQLFVQDYVVILELIDPLEGSLSYLWNFNDWLFNTN